jgi:oxygen-independent coproporphyrinogen-3 oxidase
LSSVVSSGLIISLFDLIYGLPGSSLNKLKDNLIQFLYLKPEHISCYLLTLDSDTPLAAKIKKGKVPPLPEDSLLAEEYELICSELDRAGYEQYEISNFCLPGKQSKHNLCYWKSEPYLGLGASAAGFLPPIVIPILLICMITMTIWKKD